MQSNATRNSGFQTIIKVMVKFLYDHFMEYEILDECFLIKNFYIVYKCCETYTKIIL